MNSTSGPRTGLAIPPKASLRKGFLIAVVLWTLFLVITAYTSAATLLERVASTDVMKAATEGAFSGKIAGQVLGFLFGLLLLHLAFAALTWFLACAAAVNSELACKKFGRIVVGWFSLLAAGVIAYSGYWFPRTLIGVYYHDALHQGLGPIHLGPLVYWSALAACIFVVARASITLLRIAPSSARRSALAIGVLLLLAVALVAVWPYASFGRSNLNDATRPNIIVIGIDSLRLEQLRRFGGQGVTPNIDGFLADADVFTDTTTPAARTYSSWMAILTGRAPTVTGARFNLANRSTVKVEPTFADVLREAGYRTVYSTDEVRFANIDATYGFDQVVTPRIGASDFLIGTYNDLPLPSLFINNRIGKWLFPFSYANRGVATMFQPESFLDRVRREVSFDGPTLFISHLTAAHWPYYTSDVTFDLPEPTPENPKPMYRIGLQTADRMFGDLVEMLEQKGALQNAVVIVLSDHGEALGLSSDSFFDSRFRVEGLGAPLKVLDFGHGQSVLSKSQYQILLGFRTFGAGEKFASTGRSLSSSATAEDIAPTILAFANVSGDPLRTTGVSLLPALSTSAGVVAEAQPERIRYTETDLSVLPAPGGDIDEVATARENSKYFEVDHATGRLRIRTQFEPLANAFKERAAFTKTHLLAAIPAGPYAHQYLYFDFPLHHGRVLLGRPVGEEFDEARRIWDAMHEHYGDELHPPVAITPQDWPRIDQEWASFLDRRSANKAASNAKD